MIDLPDWMGLSGLPWFFTAVQMHLHWGSGGPSHGGSEHTINGQSADAEVCLNVSQCKQEKQSGWEIITKLNYYLSQRSTCNRKTIVY